MIANTEPEPSPWSNVTHWVSDDSPTGGHHERKTWKELYEQERQHRIRAEQFQQILMDLDRNEHGRHEGDADVGDPTGVSQGNPFVRPGGVIGFDISGREYRMPGRSNQHKPEAWGPFDTEED